MKEKQLGDVVTVSKSEYVRLKKQAQAYRRLAEHVFDFSLQDPINDVVKDFGHTGLYTRAFLKDLESGLRKSSYAKGYGTRATTKRS